MKGISLIFVSFLFFSNCSSNHNNNNNNTTSVTNSTFEKAHSEFVTNIKFPEDYKFITGVDTDVIRITIFDLDKKSCMKFYRDNSFEPIGDTLPRPLACMNYLDSAYRHLPDYKKLLIKYGINNRTYWTYLIDTTTCRLYCHISFPDYNGLAK
jgi:hypothetical protein